MARFWMSVAVVLGATACVTNPATGKKQLSLVPQSQAIELGRQSADEIAQSIGLYEDPALQSYFSDLGMKLARTTEEPELPWRFQVVDDAAVNAFALPGGFIFITRGMLTHINSEASLVSVLGHEIGHVTAHHSINQMSKQQLAQLGLGLGAVFSNTVAQFGQVLGAGLSLLFLKYGRDAETQADLLGFRYTVDNGYDVRAMVDLFQTLDQVQQRAGSRLPEWLSTHPDPGNRVATTRERLAQIDLDYTHTVLNRDGYLQKLSGMVYGENPRHGFFRGQTFLHPDLRFQVEFPPDWQTQNTPGSVIAISPQQDAILQLAGAPKLSPEEAAKAFLSQQGIQAGQTTSVTVAGQPGISAPFAAQTEQGVIQGLVTFFRYRDLTYGILGYSGAPVSALEPIYRPFLASFQEVTDPAVLNVQPARLEIVRVPSAVTLAEFHRAYPSTIAIEELALINGMEPSTSIAAGTLVKRVTGGVREQAPQSSAR